MSAGRRAWCCNWETRRCWEGPKAINSERLEGDLYCGSREKRRRLENGVGTGVSVCRRCSIWRCNGQQWGPGQGYGGAAGPHGGFAVDIQGAEAGCRLRTSRRAVMAGRAQTIRQTVPVHVPVRHLADPQPIVPLPR